ncbi:MAG TPA: efflux RND transporter periplasmic adaptor subunit, partial [Verrucomicrobiae bacterium]|nr:efflux RND transporter periplasmic adaptor subunit [Verrucomicrobiae bacterium]
MNKKIFLLIILLLLTAASLGYYFFFYNRTDLPGVKVVTVGREKIEARVYAAGKIDLANKQEVRTFTPGMVKNIAVNVGDRVKKGDLLIELDTKDLDLQISQAQAAVEVAKAGEAAARSRVAQLEKLESSGEQAPQLPGLPPGTQPGLNQSGLLTGTLADARIALRQAQAMVKQANAALAIIQGQKNNARITAALEGTVLSITAVANQPAVAQVPLLVVGDLEHLVITADVNEVDAGKLAPGQDVKISGTTLGDKEFSGKIASVALMAQSAPSVQGMQTTVPAKITVDQADPALKPGFSVSLTVTTMAKPNVLQVPL